MRKTLPLDKTWPQTTILNVDRILSEDWILSKADEYMLLMQKYPNRSSGKVPGTDENWNTIDAALRYGYRGLEGGSSLSMLLSRKKSGKRKKLSGITLTYDYIWSQSKMHFRLHSRWPNDKGWADNGMSWITISQAVRQGTHGLEFRHGTLRDFINSKITDMLDVDDAKNSLDEAQPSW